MKVYMHKLFKKNEYELDNINSCCTDMKSALDDGYIKFGEADAYYNNSDKNLNLVHSTSYPECTCFEEMPISFCPFCAEPVEIIEGNEKCKHNKVYDHDHIFMSNPPKVQWICKICGERGIDTTSICRENNEYETTIKQFE
jgi:hypothetical protein